MNTPSEIRKVQPRSYIIFAAILIALLWGWWAFEHYTDFRVTRTSTNRPREPISFWIPLLGTPAFAIGMYWRWRRAAGIAENGVKVEARIAKFGIGGETRVITLAYALDRKEFQVKMDIAVDEIGARQVGDFIEIIADRRNPKRIILSSQA